jgi:hypothetical protein
VAHDGTATIALLAPVAQLDRASVYGTEGRGFEFLRAHCETPAGRGFSHFLDQPAHPDVSRKCAEECMLIADASGNADPDGPRLSCRSGPRGGLVCEIPPSRRPADSEEGWAGVERTRPARRRLFHQTPSRGDGCARYSRRRAAGRCPAWCDPTRRSPTPQQNACAIAARSVGASPRRCVTTPLH